MQKDTLIGLLSMSIVFITISIIVNGLSLIRYIRPDETNIIVNISISIGVELLAFIFMIISIIYISQYNKEEINQVKLKMANFLVSISQISIQIGFVYSFESLRYQSEIWNIAALSVAGLAGLFSFIVNILVIFGILNKTDFNYNRDEFELDIT